MSRFPVKTATVGGCAAAVLAAAVLAQPSSSAASRVQPPPKGADIQVVAVNGSGCPHGTVSVQQLPGHAGFRATYTDFRAEIKPGNILNFRKNCQFGVRMQPGPGYTYTAVSGQYRGYGKLTSGARGQQETGYYFQGQPRTASTSHPLSGPLGGSWNRTERVLLSRLGRAACGQTLILNINAQLIVYPGGSTSGPANYLTLDSANHGYTAYRFIRAHCP